MTTFYIKNWVLTSRFYSNPIEIHSRLPCARGRIGQTPANSIAWYSPLEGLGFIVGALTWGTLAVRSAIA